MALSPSTSPDDAPIAHWLVPTLHTIGLMGAMRLSLSILWPDSYPLLEFDAAEKHLREAYTLPPEFDRHRNLFESDGDPWTLNVIGHGLFGSEVYQRFRRCGHGPWAALLATTVASTAWEYGPEALHQRPSAIDLSLTPVLGIALGEARFQLFRAARGDSQETGALRRMLMILIDPLGEAERALGTEC